MKGIKVAELKTVLVVGVGALGSHVVQFLRNEAKIAVVDFDRVESKNLLSQFCGKTGVGKSKVEATKQLMNFLFGTYVTGFPHKLVENNVRAILGGADLIVDCLDNGAGRRVVQAHARANDVPCLHGALAADGGFGRVCWDQNFRIDQEGGPGQATCEGGEHLPFVAIVAAFIARAAQGYLRDGTRRGFEVSPWAVIST